MARTETFYKMGFRMPWPEEFKHAKGMISPMEIGGKEDGTYFMMCTYFAATVEELADIAAKSKNGELSEEDSQKAADAMASLVKRGYTDIIGASVYNSTEVEEMLKYDEYTTTQVPMSIFDQRLISSGTIDKLKNKDYTVFVRSVFLQGLFFLDPDTQDDPILVEHAVPRIRLLREIAASEGITVAELAIAFMRDTAGVTSLVLGADTPEQVRDNVAYFDVPALSGGVMAKLRAEFPEVDIPEIMKVLSRPKK